jgi:hypothetical protein
VVAVLTIDAGSPEKPKPFESPDGKLRAVVMVADGRKGLKDSENRIQFELARVSSLVCMTSHPRNGEHGEAVDVAR